ncbi:MAG TPA: hypothetical protein DEP23_15300, partial [Ruminococcaceae bacterium]|nr:hypothetical protein [Oscillospiraceae bacterium]
MAFAPSASAQQTGNIIIDVESGETAEELMSEDTPVWASQQVAVPTDAKALDVGGKSAVLMELSSGQVLFEKNSHEKLPIASVTKIMTMLLIMEAADSGVISLDDPVTCSAHAASLGGSQI